MPGRRVATSAVTPEREGKNVSAETTFERDIADPEALTQKLWLLCDKVSSRLKGQEIAGRTVTL